MDAFKYRAVDSPQPSLTSHSKLQGPFTDAAKDFKQRAIDIHEPMIMTAGGLFISARQRTGSFPTRRQELEAEVRRELYLERQHAMSRATPSSLINPFVLTYFSSAKLLHRDSSMCKSSVMRFGMHGGVLGHAAGFRRGVGDCSAGCPATSGASNERNNMALVDRSTNNRLVEVASPQCEDMDEHLEQKRAEKKRKAESEAVENLEEKNVTISIAGKKNKTVWSCSICQVETTSEYALKEHFNGKKHKSMEASLQKLKKKENVIERLPSLNVEHVSMNEAMKPTVVVKKRKFETLAKTNVEVNNALANIMEVTMKKYSCSLCQVTATSEKNLEKHFNGKKHKAQEASMKYKQKGKEIICDKPPAENRAASEEREGSSAKQETEKEVISDKTLVNKEFEDVSLSKQIAEANVCNEAPVDQGPKHHKHWCNLCQFGTNSVASMEIHKNGEEHLEMLLKHRGCVIIMSTKPRNS